MSIFEEDRKIDQKTKNHQKFDSIDNTGIKLSFSFASITTIVVLLSQVIPTFGGDLGHVGNWIPFLISGFLLIFLATYLFFSGFKVSHLAYFYIFSNLIIMPIVALSGIIISPYTISYEGFADFFRFAVISAGFTVGYVGWKKRLLTIKSIIIPIIISFILNLISYILFLNEPWNQLSMIYSTRTMGTGKFPGTWNYPYNLTIFLAFVSIFGFAIFLLRNRYNFSSRMLSILVSFSSLIMLIGAQSRAALVAFAIVIVLIPFILFFRALIKRDAKDIFKSLTTIFLVLFILITGYYFIFVIKTERFSYYQTLFTQFESGDLGGARIQQVINFFKTLPQNPYVIFIGFGPSRNFPIWLENIFIYFQRFGFFGFLILIIFPILITMIKSWNLLVSSRRNAYVIGFATLLFCIYISINSLTNNIFFHFRFVPLFYFLMGVFWSYSESINSE